MKLVITFLLCVIPYSLNANVLFMPEAENKIFENEVKNFITGYRDDIFKIKFAKINDEFFIYEIHDAFIYSGIYLASLNTKKSAKIISGFPKAIGYSYSDNEIKVVSQNSSMHKGIATTFVGITTCDKLSLNCNSQEIVRATWDAESGNCGRTLKHATEIVSITIETNVVNVVTKEFDCTNATTNISNQSFAM